jgi:hypothetical protein
MVSLMAEKSGDYTVQGQPLRRGKCAAPPGFAAILGIISSAG